MRVKDSTIEWGMAATGAVALAKQIQRTRLKSFVVSTLVNATVGVGVNLLMQLPAVLRRHQDGIDWGRVAASAATSILTGGLTLGRAVHDAWKGRQAFHYLQLAAYGFLDGAAAGGAEQMIYTWQHEKLAGGPVDWDKVWSEAVGGFILGGFLGSGVAPLLRGLVRPLKRRSKPHSKSAPLDQAPRQKETPPKRKRPVFTQPNRVKRPHQTRSPRRPVQDRPASHGEVQSLQVARERLEALNREMEAHTFTARVIDRVRGLSPSEQTEATRELMNLVRKKGEFQGRLDEIARGTLKSSRAIQALEGIRGEIQHIKTQLPLVAKRANHHLAAEDVVVAVAALPARRIGPSTVFDLSSRAVDLDEVQRAIFRGPSQRVTLFSRGRSQVTILENRTGFELDMQGFRHSSLQEMEGEARSVFSGGGTTAQVLNGRTLQLTAYKSIFNEDKIKTLLLGLQSILSRILS